MAFRLPNFNLSVNLWRSPSLVTAPPDLSFLGNLSPGRRVNQQPTWGLYGNGFTTVVMELLCPALTDIRGSDNSGNYDCVEVPAGSGRFYAVATVDDTAKGFPNEYRFAWLLQINGNWLGIYPNPWACPIWPSPLP